MTIKNCKIFYQRLSRKCRTHGLDNDWIKKNIDKLSYHEDGSNWVSESHYKPTGVALGCPLPNRNYIRRLWQISRLFEKIVTNYNCHGKSFAFVPPDFYHITVVNKTHYQNNLTIKPLTISEKEKAEDLINKSNIGPVKILFNGLVLSPRGALLVRGYHICNRIDQLRDILSKANLCSNIPMSAHIKLGHLITTIERDVLDKILYEISFLGDLTTSMLYFTDLYTPRGRIPL